MYEKLLNADDPTGFEVPGDDWSKFPYDELQAEVDSIRLRVEQKLGLTLGKDGCVQDASFLDELWVLNPRSHQPNGVTCLIPDLGIRFSNFGKLYMIYSATNSLENYPVEEIKEIIDQVGWTFIEEELLNKEYDGINAQLHGEITWRRRFFDYV